MGRILVSRFSFGNYDANTDFKYAKEVSDGILDAIEQSNFKVLKSIDLGGLFDELFDKITADYSDESLTMFAKSLFNNENITLDMLDINIIVRNYASSISYKYIRKLQEKFDCFIKQLENMKV